MNLDVVILAGGLGTRLRGYWDGPKCLAPVADRPLLFRLLELTARLRPRQITLALGHLADEVLRAVDAEAERGANRTVLGVPLLHVVDPIPAGTVAALRRALAETEIKPPVLVLNGDTLPVGYQLAGLAVHHETLGDVDATAAWSNGRAAGAAVLSAGFLSALGAEAETDLARLIANQAHRYYVPGYLDVGTPFNLHRAKHLRRSP